VNFFLHHHEVLDVPEGFPRLLCEFTEFHDVTGRKLVKQPFGLLGEFGKGLGKARSTCAASGRVASRRGSSRGRCSSCRPTSRDPGGVSATGILALTVGRRGWRPGLPQPSDDDCR
jgi:hypothetical protein